MRRWMVASCLCLLMGVGALGCADPNRELCREACQAVDNCERTLGNFDDAFLDSCVAQCDEADEVNEKLARCLKESSCEAIRAGGCAN